MTRYIYFPHSEKELPITRHFDSTQKAVVWVYCPACGARAMTFRSTDENWLLFLTKEDCISYYQ